MRVKKLLLLSWSICLILVLAALPFMTACSTDDVETPTNGDTETPTNGDTETPTNETLKIGYIGYLGFFVGLDMLHGLEAAVNMINEQGGVTIGDKTYDIELISYDSNSDQATAIAAANRLIFEDEVKFIVCDSVMVDAVLPITEANQVIFCSTDPSQGILSPDNHYSFCSSFLNAGTSVLIGWFIQNNPDMDYWVIAEQDNMMGQALAALSAPVFEAFGITAEFEFFPEGATDLSSLGTKVKTLNPDVFFEPDGYLNAYKAVRDAGYTGQLFGGTTTVSNLLTQLTAEDLEGYIGSAIPTEFDPALTQTAQDFKDAWIDYHGSWEGPEITMAANFYCILAALQEAGTLDTDVVADVIGSGLEFDTPVGPGMMFSRPDIGNERTVDSIQTIYVKQIVGGEATLLATIEVDEGLVYFRQVNPE